MIPIDIYASCLESSIRKDSYFEKSDYISGANKQYSLNQYVSSCHKIDNNSISLIAIKGRYSGTIQTVPLNMLNHKKLLYNKLKFNLKKICLTKFLMNGPRRNLNNQEMELVKKTLKIKYFQDALDQLNRLN